MKNHGVICNVISSKQAPCSFRHDLKPHGLLTVPPGPSFQDHQCEPRNKYFTNGHWLHIRPFLQCVLEILILLPPPSPLNSRIFSQIWIECSRSFDWKVTYRLSKEFLVPIDLIIMTPNSQEVQNIRKSNFTKSCASNSQAPGSLAWIVQSLRSRQPCVSMLTSSTTAALLQSRESGWGTQAFFLLDDEPSPL